MTAELRVALTDVGQHFHAIAAGQRQVEQHQVEGLAGDARQAVFAALGGVDAVAFELEQGLERFADLRLVVHDQDRGSRCAFLIHGYALQHCGMSH